MTNVFCIINDRELWESGEAENTKELKQANFEYKIPYSLSLCNN